LSQLRPLGKLGVTECHHATLVATEFDATLMMLENASSNPIVTPTQRSEILKKNVLVLHRGEIATLSEKEQRSRTHAIHVDHWGRASMTPIDWPKPSNEADEALIQWALAGNEGASAMLVARVLYPYLTPPPEGSAIPDDYSSVLRCESLFEAVPTTRERFGAVAAAVRAWEPVVSNWTSLVSLSRQAAAGNAVAKLSVANLLRSGAPHEPEAAPAFAP